MTLAPQFLAKILTTSVQCQNDFLLIEVNRLLLSWPEIWTKQVQEDIYIYRIIYHTVQRVLIMKKSVRDKCYIQNSIVYTLMTT